jgi:uncharacterized protein DUF6879
MATLLTPKGFADQFGEFRTAWRLEARSDYRLGYERAEFEHFQAGRPRPPEQVSWWRDYLVRVDGWISDGREIGRVRLDDDEPTPYQSWLAWCEPFHRKAGEDIRHMPRARATALGIPGYDFWLFDSERLVLMLFDRAGNLTRRILIRHADAPDLVDQHLAWRDLAVRNATAAAPAVA